MTSNVSQRLKDAGARLAQTAAALQSSSPLAVLARGYSFCTRPGGEPVRDAASLKDGDLLNIRMRDGSVSAAVTAAGGAD